MNFYIWLVIIGGSIVTILPKTLPILILSKINLNKKVLKFLSFIPITILSCLIISEIFISNDAITFNLAETIAIIITIIIAIKKDNLLLTVIIGVITLALLRLLL